MDQLHAVFSPEVVGGFFAILISVIFARFPKVSTWYAGQTTELKSGLMILMLLFVFVLIVFSGVSGLVAWYLPSGTLLVWNPIPWATLIITLGTMLLTNQATYTIVPESKAVKAAKLARNNPIDVIPLPTSVSEPVPGINVIPMPKYEAGSQEPRRTRTNKPKSSSTN